MRYIKLKVGEVVIDGDEHRQQFGKKRYIPTCRIGEVVGTSAGNITGVPFEFRRPLKPAVAVRSASTNKRSTVRKPQPKLAKRKLRAA